MSKSKFIAVDFDGTCVTNAYPNIGEDAGAVPVLQEIAEAGNKIILLTMRSGVQLEDAVNWFKEKGIPLYSINSNPTQKWWTQSPKVFANAYIDDCNVGCPMSGGHVDWDAIRTDLVKRGFI